MKAIFSFIIISFSFNFIIFSFSVNLTFGHEARNVKDLNLLSNISTLKTNSIDQVWQSEAQNSIVKEEYNIFFDNKTNSYQSPNRNNNIRFIYHNDRFTANTRQTKIPYSMKVKL